ncbi:MAG: YciI family protein [Vicinamibacterales bacterium]
MSQIQYLRAFALSTLLCSMVVQGSARAEQPAASPQSLPLFAVEITVGPNWDQSKPPQAQQYFREHSANLKRLRDAGSLVMGARYSDKGLVILAARSEDEARAFMDVDPSIKAGVFKYEVHAFSVFYSGTLAQPPRRPAVR